MKKFIFAFASFLTFSVSGALWALPTKSLTFQWQASPDTVQGYKLYFSNTSGQYTQANSIDVGNVTTYTWQVSTPGTYFIVTTAYTSSNGVTLESQYSNEITFTIPRPPIMLSISNVALSIKSYQGANVLVQSSIDFKNWANQATITNASADTVSIPLVKWTPYQFYRANYIASNVPMIREQTLPPALPVPQPPKLTIVKKLQLLLRYRPGNHPDLRKGSERMTGK